MTKILHRLFCGGVASLVVFAASNSYAVFSQRGDAVLSVDINGGSGTDNRTLLGWTGSVGGTVPVGIDDLAGPPVGNGAPFVLWQPWGGPTGQGGDGTNLPNNAADGTAISMSKNFTTSIGPVGVTISTAGTLANYGNLGNINSRDRGPIGQTDHGGVTEATDAAAHYDNENRIGRQLYRDLIFAPRSGTAVRGTNFLKIEFSGLTPGQPYQASFYAYDRSQTQSAEYSATDPTLNSSGNLGWWENPTLTAANSFVAPADMEISPWVSPASSGNTNPLPTPVTLSRKANALGIATFYSWGFNGDYTLPEQSNFAGNSYMNGFQLAVPEPGSMILGMFGLAGMMLGRRRG
jgi:hypothetical protein